MSVVPALYEADVTHARRSPLGTTSRTGRPTGWWTSTSFRSREGFARWFAGVAQQDHVDIRRFLKDRGIAATRVVMLTGARSFGYAFDPISVFWCYDEADAQCAVVAEVHNTYGDRHAYVLELDADGEAEIEKAMYVSPFNGRRRDVSDPGRAPRHPPFRHLGDPSNEKEKNHSWPRLRERGDALTTTVGPVVHGCVIRAPRTRLLIQWQGLRLWGRGLEVQPR